MICPWFVHDVSSIHAAEFLRLAEGREVTEGARRADAVMVRQNTQVEVLRTTLVDLYE